MLKSVLPDDVKVNFTIDDTRLRLKLTTYNTTSYTETSFCIQY